jgi:hypothetical protein
LVAPNNRVVNSKNIKEMIIVKDLFCQVGVKDRSKLVLDIVTILAWIAQIAIGQRKSLILDFWGSCIFKDKTKPTLNSQVTNQKQ